MIFFELTTVCQLVFSEIVNITVIYNQAYDLEETSNLRLSNDK